MAMSDCEKCWETPCSCGWEYKDYSEVKMIDFIFEMLKYHDDEYKLNVLSELVEIFKKR